MKIAFWLRGAALTTALACGLWCGTKWAAASGCTYHTGNSYGCTACYNAGWATVSTGPGMPPMPPPSQLYYLNVTCQPRADFRCQPTYYLAHPGPDCVLTLQNCPDELSYSWSQTSGTCSGGPGPSSTQAALAMWAPGSVQSSTILSPQPNPCGHNYYKGETNYTHASPCPPPP